ncbi:hypothetical protein FSP39_024922 [Pinctada imbricata]|uniref:Copper type II ascorbate-dependent monooxygenase C-terminal domain-containing protein n=1 Tax=Pinctada imbricata TaxID=66713 RepID=A0AA88Y6F8_PINIB|nr:hypothetical protein FSP39_024922 [Pinctada imbricata]
MSESRSRSKFTLRDLCSQDHSVNDTCTSTAPQPPSSCYHSSPTRGAPCYVPARFRDQCICEPYDNDECKKKNTWVTCDTTEFRCDALDREDPNDLRNITIQFPRTKVPSSETSYYCMTFDLPEDEDLHMIATEPIIDNAYVMHHILLFGCEPSAELMTSPSPCDMKVRYCENLIGIWTVGFQGECFNPEAGFLIGNIPKAYKRVAMQFHWNNPLKENDYYDESGMILHLTQNKRIHNAGVLVVGQNYLQLTPGEEKIEVVGTCTNEMSKMRLVGPIHITRVFNHMHYLEVSMPTVTQVTETIETLPKITEIMLTLFKWTRLPRDLHLYTGYVKLRDLSFDEVYSYDSPVFHVHREAIEFQRGDEIRTTCTYKTKGRKKTVFHGDATSDEMCYGFLTFYPAENARSPWCVERRNTDPFSYYTENVSQNCPFRDFMNMTHPDTQRLHTRILSHCSHLGLCLKECISVVRELRANHPCLQGDIHEYLRERARNGGMETIQLALFFSSIDSCNTEIATMDCPVINSTPDQTSASHIAKFSPHLIFLGALHFITTF